jgi:hypothetical protein
MEMLSYSNWSSLISLCKSQTLKQLKTPPFIALEIPISFQSAYQLYMHIRRSKVECYMWCQIIQTPSRKRQHTRHQNTHSPSPTTRFTAQQNSQNKSNPNQCQLDYMTEIIWLIDSHSQLSSTSVFLIACYLIS